MHMTATLPLTNREAPSAYEKRQGRHESQVYEQPPAESDYNWQMTGNEPESWPWHCLWCRCSPPQGWSSSPWGFSRKSASSTHTLSLVNRRFSELLPRLLSSDQSAYFLRPSQPGIARVAWSPRNARGLSHVWLQSYAEWKYFRATIIFILVKWQADVSHLGPSMFWNFGLPYDMQIYLHPS